MKIKRVSLPVSLVVAGLMNISMTGTPAFAVTPGKVDQASEQINYKRKVSRLFGASTMAVLGLGGSFFLTQATSVNARGLRSSMPAPSQKMNELYDVESADSWVMSDSYGHNRELKGGKSKGSSKKDKKGCKGHKTKKSSKKSSKGPKAPTTPEISYELPDVMNVPSLDDRIAIIGGGPAGVDMAVQLKKLGYQDVTILEQNAEVGGKALTLDVEGVPYDIGATFLLPVQSYGDVIDLLQEYGKDSRLILPGIERIDSAASCGVLNIGDPDCAEKTMTFSENLIARALMAEPNLIGAPQEAIIGAIFSQLLNYEELHQSILGHYNYRLPPRPYDFSELSMTAEEFMEQNDLNLLWTVFMAFQTLPGYGYLNEVPAYYLLHWVNQGVIDYLKASLTQSLGNSSDDHVTVLQGGFQALWEAMVETEQLEVERNFEVQSIDRSKNSIVIEGLQDGKAQSFCADYIFVATPHSKTLPLLNDPSPEESMIFSKLEHSVMTSTLISGSGFDGDPPSLNSFDNAVQASEDTQLPWWSNCQECWFNPQFNRSQDKRTMVVQQYHYERGQDISAEFSLDALNNTMHTLSTGSPVIEDVHYQGVYDDYFGRFTIEGLELTGPWAILGIQGERNTVYIGSVAAAFESVSDVVNYNRLIVDKIRSSRP